MKDTCPSKIVSSESLFQVYTTTYTAKMALRVTTVLSLGGSIKPTTTIGSIEVGEFVDRNNTRQLRPEVLQVTTALPFDSLVTVTSSILGGEFGSLEDPEKLSKPLP